MCFALSFFDGAVRSCESCFPNKCRHWRFSAHLFLSRSPSHTHSKSLNLFTLQSQCIDIKPEWLVEIAPHYYNGKDIADSSSKKLPKAVGAVSKAQKAPVKKISA